MVPGGGLRGQTSLSVGALLGNLVEGGGGLIYRGLAKALERGTFLHRGPVKYHGVSVHKEL